MAATAEPHPMKLNQRARLLPVTHFEAWYSEAILALDGVVSASMLKLA
jgi:hypothetical protein